MALHALTPALIYSLWGFTKFLNQLCITIYSRLHSSLLSVHLLPLDFSLPLIFPWLYFDTVLCYRLPFQQWPSLASLWRLSVSVFWLSVNSAAFQILETFELTVKESRIYTVFFFSNKWQEILNSFIIFCFFRCTCSPCVNVFVRVCPYNDPTDPFSY